MAKRDIASTVRTITVDIASKTKTPSTIGDRKTVRPAFANYVTRNQEFLVHVRDMRDQIENYIIKGTAKRPLNILLAAPPGSGKSFLIKQMMSSITAPNVQLSPLEEIYIASLENADELFKTFQRVQSINLEGKIPVVFYDEIDAQVAHSHVYAKFLAPMWDGTFYLGKDKFYLGKCVFFFAGSGLSLETASKKILRSLARKRKPISYEDYYDAWKADFDKYHAADTFVKQKLPDFLDRIDSTLRIPPVCEELLGKQRANDEYDDLACMLIRKHFPDVRFVEKEALRIIRDTLKDQSSMRTAEKIVFNSKSKPEEDYELLDISCLPRRYRVTAPKRQQWWEVVSEPA